MEHSPDITHIGFRPPHEARLSVEALSIEELRKRAPPDHFEKLQRADFYRIFGIASGSTRPMVDFSNFAAKPGDWVLVRPRQVFRYDFTQTWTGWLLVFRPEALAGTARSGAGLELDPLRRIEELPCVSSLGGDAHAWMARSLQQMQSDAALPAEVVLRNELLRLQLTSTLLRLTMWQSSATGSGDSTPDAHTHFRRFRSLLERDFSVHHQVQHYAGERGMSDKTRSRVCVAAAGLPAKALINQRLVLEAKRLLAHTSTAVQTVGYELGFHEASNFVKFFRKETQITPVTFRQQAANMTS